MTIKYVGVSVAKEGQGEALRGFLETAVLPAVKASAGCRSCLLHQDLDNPNRFLLIEVWDSVEDHRASIKNISKDAIGEYMKLVAEPPAGSHYRLLAEV